MAWATELWLAAHNAGMEIVGHKTPLVVQQLRTDGTERLIRAGA